MKATLNIPDERINALLRATKAKTRTEAVNKAIDEYIRRRNLQDVLDLAGSIEDFTSKDELMHSRNAD